MREDRENIVNIPHHKRGRLNKLWHITQGNTSGIKKITFSFQTNKGINSKCAKLKKL